MSASDPSDPRLLLPDWLRDGDVLASANPVAASAPPESIAETVIVATAPVVEPVAPALPFSDRLSLDTRLDPGQLVSAADLPKWLGGLEPVTAATTRSTSSPAAAAALNAQATIEEPEPYTGIDAPADGVVDVQINGWILVAAAIGLLILLAAALKLYLS